MQALEKVRGPRPFTTISKGISKKKALQGRQILNRPKGCESGIRLFDFSLIAMSARYLGDLTLEPNI